MRNRKRQMASARSAQRIASVGIVQTQIDHRMCNEKIRYRTKTEARQKLRFVRETKGGGHIFECTVCHGFHITSWSREDSRRNRRLA